jgi:hypothetical protein
MGLFTLTFSLSMMISPVLGTWVYNRFGPQTLWMGAGATGLLIWAGLQRMRRSGKIAKSVNSSIASEIA